MSVSVDKMHIYYTYDTSSETIMFIVKYMMFISISEYYGRYIEIKGCRKIDVAGNRKSIDA